MAWSRRMHGLEKVGGVGTALMVWRRVRVDIRHPSGWWFLRNFVAAAAVVVDRWGPRWARWPVGKSPIGAWLLLALWLGLPVILLRRLW